MRAEQEANRTKGHVELITADRPNFDVTNHANRIAAQRDLQAGSGKTDPTIESALDNSEFVWGVRIR